MNPNNDSYWSSRDSGKSTTSSNHDYDDWDYDDEVETQPKEPTNSKKKEENK